MIGRNGERRSGISAPAARHDDDDDCSLEVNKFEHQSRYYVYFWIYTLGEGINPIITLLFFYDDGFGIK